MQCPNCGRNVRSTTQCAHCGYKFGQSDLKEAKQAAPASAPVHKKRRGGGFWNVLWGILKLVVLVVLIFLLFLYGPQLISKVTDFFGSSDTQLSQNAPEEPQGESPVVVEEESSTQEISQEASVLELSDASTSDAESDMSASDESADDSASNAEDEGRLTLADVQANLDEYPRITVRMTFNEDLANVDRETFDFALTTDGETTPIEDEYSLVKDGKELIISYSDPTVGVLQAEESKQTLAIEAPDLHVSETVEYTLPLLSVDQAQFNQLNDLINENLAQNATVTAVMSSSEDDVPFTYDNHSVDAGNAISWFVLARTYEQLEAGNLELEQGIEIQDGLKAANEETPTSMTEAGESMTVDSLIAAVIQNQDVSAMNHLIQAVGGPNEFNLWLNESGYFATRLTQILDVSQASLIEGAVTSAQDIARLLSQLSQDQLISPEMDAAFKEALLDSPMTEKYPSSGIDVVNRRYEITSSDSNPTQQYYTAILEGESQDYVVVLLVSDFSEPETVISQINALLNDSVTYLETGSLPEEVEEEPESEEPTSESEVAPEDTEPAPEVPTQNQPQGQEGGFSMQHVENTGEDVMLPNRYRYNEQTGQQELVKWFYDHEAQTYKYYP